MKRIVIEISDDMYNRIAASPRCADGLDAYKDRDEFCKAIQNGTVISGCGRLIDADKELEALDTLYRINAIGAASYFFSSNLLRHADTVVSTDSLPV